MKNNLAPNNVDSNHVDSNHVDSNHVDSNHVDSNHVDSNNVDSNPQTSKTKTRPPYEISHKQIPQYELLLEMIESYELTKEVGQPIKVIRDSDVEEEIIKPLHELLDPSDIIVRNRLKKIEELHDELLSIMFLSGEEVAEYYNISLVFPFHEDEKKLRQKALIKASSRMRGRAKTLMRLIYQLLDVVKAHYVLPKGD